MTDDENIFPEPDSHDEPSSTNLGRPLIIQSVDLLQGRREIWIEHGDEMYRLRVTANDKLYLTK